MASSWLVALAQKVTEGMSKEMVMVETGGGARAPLKEQ
jgi:hypothetical protein